MDLPPIPRPQTAPRNLKEFNSGRMRTTRDAVPDVEVTGISHDSRSLVAGDLYMALPGENTHGMRFWTDALDRGAVAIVTDAQGLALAADPPPPVPVVVVEDPRAIMGALSSWIYGEPSHALRIIGITGTDGKTTTALMAAAALRADGEPTAVIGTVGIDTGDAVYSATRTTPEATDLHAYLLSLSQQGARTVIMEVSSHALVLGRVDGVQFDLCVFTNLGADHLDFHGTQEEYFAAKSRLFEPDRCARALVNGADPWGLRLAAGVYVPAELLAVEGDDVPSTDWPRTWVMKDVEAVGAGSRGRVTAPQASGIADQVVEVPLPGRFNLRNGLAAFATAVSVGADPELAAAGIAAFAGPPGRMEQVTVPASPGAIVLVDYAHTPDGVERALGVGRELADRRGGRLIVVIGSGGNRDPHKRPLFGRAVAESADIAIITDDNPRDEDPAAIRAAIVAGARSVPDHRAQVWEVAGRVRALESAVERARDGDVVMALGKGHETTQEIRGDFVELDDRSVLAAVRALPGQNR